MPNDERLLLPPAHEPKLLEAPRGGAARRPKIIIAVALAALCAFAFAIGFYFHYQRQRAINEAAERAKSALPSVAAVVVRPSTAVSRLLLPGSIAPITEASLYARAAGYVRARYVDIGDRVRKGQVLADIESPELDQQVTQARQQLGQANAAVTDAIAKIDLARVTWERYRTLLEQDSASRQDADQKHQEYQSAQASLESSRANVGAAEANLRRLVALQDFEKVRAPFDGIVTVRNVDVGALIASSGGSRVPGGPAVTAAGATASTATASIAGGQSSELFRVAQIDRLRILVGVPQANATAMRIGSSATVFVQEFAKRFAGKVTRSANALDAASRTLLTEVEVANPDLLLLPGMYAQIEFDTARGNPPLLVPGNSVSARAGGTQIAVLQELSQQEREKLPPSTDADHAKRIHLQSVAIGRDYGTEIEITEGLRGDEWVVANPGDAVQENAIVIPRLAAASSQQQAGEKSGGASEKSPSGISSPSMPAPTQGAAQKSGKQDQRGQQPRAAQSQSKR